MPSRRAFLRTSLRASTLVALAPTVPAFLTRAARAAPAERDGKTLVVIELAGGNDGLNTVVPFKDEGYRRHRKVLRLPADQLCTVNREIGLHPAMREAAGLLEDGRLAVVQGVGYPNPSRSHFHSMAIWQTARPDIPRPKGDTASDEHKTLYGWIGQALDGGRGPADGSAAAVYVGEDDPPVAFRGRRARTSTVSRPEDAVLTLAGRTGTDSVDPENGSELAAFVRRSTLDAYATSERMAEVLRVKDAGAGYPPTRLAARLRDVARLIKGGLGTRVYYTSQSGYDTHTFQLPAQADLLGELSGALKAFLDDLAAAKLAERVAVLCFSEFGRRVAENGSQGTDHGTAGPVFLAGVPVRGGLVGLTPSLADLEDGDLKMTTDFRRVYATVLEEWLGLSAREALGGTFAKLPLFAG
jgi:uncharacterized protein (DUF1501 family)